MSRGDQPRLESSVGKIHITAGKVGAVLKKSELSQAFKSQTFSETRI